MSAENKKVLKCDLVRNSGEEISRRDFLGTATLWSCIGAWLVTFMGLAKFPLPALLPDIASVFKIGDINDIPVGVKKVFEAEKVLVMRDKQGIRAVSLVCTHLGCIVTKEENGYSCPCHGSKFDEEGNVFAGPAPKGLVWLEVSQLPNGKLAVNTNKPVSEETRFVV